jgi:hypothetical protein
MPYPSGLHGDFWAWGPGLEDPRVVLILGGTAEELEALFREVVEASSVSNPLGVEEEQQVPIHVCRGLREPLRDIWDRLGPVWG